MTHVLFVTSTLAVGGAEKHLRELAPGLRRHGLEPSVLTLRHEGRFFAELRREGIPVRCLEMRSRFDVVRARRALVRTAPAPEVVVTQGADAHALGRLVARRTHATHVTIEHGGPGLDHRLHHRLVYRLIAPGVAAAIAVTDEQRGPLVGLGFRAEQIRVIPNGIVPLVARATREESRRRLGLMPDAFVAALVATLRPEKRAVPFVEAVAAAHRQEGRIRGLVAGGGPDLPRVRAAARSAGDVVSVLGEVPDVAELIAACDVVCLLSRAEGLPLVVLEAMSLARPVLAPAVGGLLGAIETGVNGILVPPNDDAAFVEALVALARDPRRVEALGRAARARFDDRYTVERMTSAYARLLREVARTGASGGAR